MSDLPMKLQALIASYTGVEKVALNRFIGAAKLCGYELRATDKDWVPHEAIEQLRDHQTQLDADGCMVGVSRQAIDEVLAYIAAAEKGSE